MRWFWRLLTLFVFLGLVRNIIVPQQKVFIASPEEQNWVQKIQGDMRQWQKFTQDLPASIEVEVRRLWNDFQPNGDVKEV